VSEELTTARQPYYEAQQAVIGSLLLDDRVAGMVMSRTRAEDYQGACRTLYRVCRELFIAGTPIDPVTVRHKAGQEYGDYIKQLMDITPTANNCELYIDILLEQSKMARCRALAQDINEAVTLEDMQRAISTANRILGGRSSVRVVSAEEGYKDFYERMSEPPKLITWGMDRIDNTLRVEYGDFIVLGGYPSAGKTAFSLQLAWNQSKERRVGYFSLETKPEKLIDRAVAAVCGVDLNRIKAHQLTDEDWDSCALKAPAFVGRSLDIIQAGALSVAEIQALTLAGQYEIIYVDYLQLVVPEDRRRSITEQVTQISMDLHTMAQTTGVTVCALSQLSRAEQSGRQEKSPGLHSLRQSGQIEQDADGVMLLYKEEPQHPNSRRVLKIAKNKEGPAGGLIYLLLDGAHQRFRVDPRSKPPAAAKPETSAQLPKPENEQLRMDELPDTTPVPWEETARMGNASAGTSQT